MLLVVLVIALLGIASTLILAENGGAWSTPAETLGPPDWAPEP